MKRMLLAAAITGLAGCTNAIHIPLDATSLSKDDATVVVWMDQKLQLINEDVSIYVDDTEVGTISAKVPLKVSVPPGHHRIYGSAHFFMIIRRETEVDLKPGEVSFFRTYLQHGPWTTSLYTVPTEPAPYYDSVIHSLHDD